MNPTKYAGSNRTNLLRQADMGASYAVGVVRGGRLLLAPLDQVMQLRPSLAHLDRGGADKPLNGIGGSDATAADERETGAGPAADGMDEDDANGMEMEPVRVRTVWKSRNAFTHTPGRRSWKQTVRI